jgi:hypothetical protein
VDKGESFPNQGRAGQLKTDDKAQRQLNLRHALIYQKWPTSTKGLFDCGAPRGRATISRQRCLFALLFLLEFTGTGVGLLSGAALFYAGHQELIARGQRTPGRVVELVYQRRGYAPVYEYELDGRV